MVHFVQDFEPHPKRMAPDPVAPEAPVELVPTAPVVDEPPAADLAPAADDTAPLVMFPLVTDEPDLPLDLPPAAPVADI
jgi:hypothetical protein